MIRFVPLPDGGYGFRGGLMAWLSPSKYNDRLRDERSMIVALGVEKPGWARLVKSGSRWILQIPATKLILRINRLVR